MQDRTRKVDMAGWVVRALAFKEAQLAGSNNNSQSQSQPPPQPQIQSQTQAQAQNINSSANVNTSQSQTQLRSVNGALPNSNQADEEALNAVSGKSKKIGRERVGDLGVGVGEKRGGVWGCEGL